MNNFIVEGCPRLTGNLCCFMCDGGWPGTTITSEALTKAILNGNLDPDKLGCQPLIDRAKEGIKKLNDSYDD